MSTPFVLFTGLEIIIALLLVWGFKNEQKLIHAENLFIRFIGALIKTYKKKRKADHYRAEQAQRAKRQADARVQQEQLTAERYAGGDIIPFAGRHAA